MTRAAILAGIAILLTTVPGSNGEDVPKVSKYTDVTWYEIVHVDFFPDKHKEALDIVFDHFYPAARAAGLERARILEYATGGEWDVTYIFPMKDGPAQLEWEMSPDSVKWRSALAKRVGGDEQAKELLDHYRKMINRYESQIVRERIVETTKMTEATR
ncbi:MAG: hypothetical protein ACE5EC_05575 [Phycisphaerae bacterium]